MTCGFDVSAFSEWPELLFSRWGGEKTDKGQAQKRRKKRWKNGIARRDGLGQVGVDKLRVPENRNERASGNTRNRRRRSSTLPEESGENNRREGCGVDG